MACSGVHGISQFEDGYGQYNTFLGRPEVESFDVVITSMVLVCHRPTSVLFTLGSTLFFLSTHFPLGIYMKCEAPVMTIHISTH